MNRTTKILSGLGFGAITTLALATGILKPTVKLVALSSLVCVPVIGVSHWVIQDKANEKIKAIQDKLDLAKKDTQKLAAATADNERLSQYLVSLKNELSQLQNFVTSLKSENSRLKESQQLQSAQIEVYQKEKKMLNEQIVEYEETYSSELESEVQQKVDEYIASDRAKLDAKYRSALMEGQAIHADAVSIAKAYEEWAEQVGQRHAERRDYILGLTKEFNGHISGIEEDWKVERGHLITQIEIYTNQIARLQQKLAGDLVEPIYLKCGFSPEGQIANAVAEWLWNHQRIPLKVTGVESTDSLLTAGYSYSHSMPIQELIKAIEDNSPVIARTLGLYAIEKPHKLPIADILTLKIKRERPSRKTNTLALYRNQQEFIKYILSQPIRFRLIGEPGAGKTPTVAVMLAHLLARGFLEANTPNGRKLPYTIVEFCNPLAGISVKNSTDLDFCLKWDSGCKGFKGLAEEYRFRKNKSNANYKNQVGYIWVADEIDNSMAELTKDEAKPFKNSLKDGGHINIGVIVMGQSANVSTSKGLSIDDQKMMTNIYIDSVSIRTFLSQYGERFYSRKTVEKALNTLEEIELEIEEQNEVICDTARELRIAMVTAQRSPVFYQLPYFDSTVIDVASYQKNLEKVIAIRSGRGETLGNMDVLADYQNPDYESLSTETDTSGHSPYAESGTSRDTSQRPNCPHCGSSIIRSKGNKWECKNPEHSTIAPGKPKSWKKC
ncbi:MAG: hypothetical protein F6K21_11695 [Symploca sp. SIO2D2]|nr:hypothetical protein [Symploca sp. SIO2D2]